MSLSATVGSPFLLKLVNWIVDIDSLIKAGDIN